jgi:hypothetical protein
MWDNFDGPFVLKNRHAAIFRVAAASLSDHLGWSDKYEGWETGNEVFDSLSLGQKQAAILLVVKALLDPAVEPPRVIAAVAATVDVIYREIEGLIDIELDFGEETNMRRRLLDAMDEANYWEDVNDGVPEGEDPEGPPEVTSEDSSAWMDLVESLRTEILEDYDFDMAGKFLDMESERAAELKRLMNIEPDYFVANVEDPTPQQLDDIARELHSRLGSEYGGAFAVTTHRGPYDKLGETYARLCGEWLPASGREARSAPSFEMYRNSPRDTSPADLLTDIYLPLEDE